jgi:hypothetical protein
MKTLKPRKKNKKIIKLVCPNRMCLAHRGGFMIDAGTKLRNPANPEQILPIKLCPECRTGLVRKRIK